MAKYHETMQQLPVEPTRWPANNQVKRMAVDVDAELLEARGLGSVR